MRPTCRACELQGKSLACIKVVASHILKSGSIANAPSRCRPKDVAAGQVNCQLAVEYVLSNRLCILKVRCNVAEQMQNAIRRAELAHLKPSPYPMRFTCVRKASASVIEPSGQALDGAALPTGRTWIVDSCYLSGNRGCYLQTSGRTGITCMSGEQQCKTAD